MLFDRLLGIVLITILTFSVAVAAIQLIRGEDWLHALCFLCTVSIVLYIELDSYFIGFPSTIHEGNRIILLIQRTLYFLGCIGYGFHALRSMRRRKASCIRK